jgi:hypothetical protein
VKERSSLIRTLAALVLGPAAWALLGVACARQVPGPADTLVTFGAAVERKDYAAAYALTSAEFQARVPLAAFRTNLEADGAEAQALGRQLRTDAARRPARAELELDLGQSVTLVEQGGAWRVDAAPFEPWGQQTPRAALRSFIRALEQRRYDIVLRLCPNRHRAGLSIQALRDYWEGPQKDDNAQLVARLRAAVRAPIVESGDEANMPYAERAEVHFVREDGAWKIEDPG